MGDPRSGSKVWEALDREIGKPGENRGQIVAHGEFPAKLAPPHAAAHKLRHQLLNFRSRLCARQLKVSSDEIPFAADDNSRRSGDVAAFIDSDRASAIAGTSVDLGCGSAVG